MVVTIHLMEEMGMIHLYLVVGMVMTLLLAVSQVMLLSSMVLARQMFL